MNAASKIEYKNRNKTCLVLDCIPINSRIFQGCHIQVQVNYLTIQRPFCTSIQKISYILEIIVTRQYNSYPFD